jgi:hypothetical protein
MKEFFIHDGEAEKGPYTLEQLKSISLKKETLVWFDGLEQWTIAGNLPELNELFVTKLTPPPLTKTINESLAGTYVHVPAEPLPQQKKKSYLMPLGITAVVVIAVIIWLMYQDNKNNETITTLQTQVSTQQLQKDQKEDEQKKINEAIAKKNLEYRNNWEKYIRKDYDQLKIDYGLGGISQFNVHISNETEYMLDEVDVLVEYIRKNGEVWQSRTVSFSNIAPGTAETKVAPSSVNGVNVRLAIQKIVSKKMQFCYPFGSDNTGDPYFCD